MGKPKAKPKKSVEENEFLKGLIDEVQSMDNSDELVIDEDGPESKLLTPGMHEDGEHVAGYVENNLTKNSDDDLPTVFQHIREDIKAPKLRKDMHSDLSESRTAPQEKSRSNEKTVASIDSDPSTAAVETAAQNTAATAGATILNAEPDRTIAVEGARGGRPLLQEKVATGALKGTRSGQVYTSLDASLAQAETLKIAQSRIKELENEIDRLRQENDDLSSAGDVVTRRMEDYQIRVQRLEKEKSDLAEQAKNERLILKGNLQFKETELSKTKAKLEDLEMRIKTDFRKIRVRERELENRLELVRGEKQALMRAKDEKILDLQRKLDQYKTELDLYRAKVQDLNKLMESQHDQMQKTIRALRVALVNLEHDDSTQEQDSEVAEAADEAEEQRKAKG